MTPPIDEPTITESIKTNKYELNLSLSLSHFHKRCLNFYVAYVTIFFDFMQLYHMFVCVYEISCGHNVSQLL